MTQPRPDWDDERLGAAFAARAARTPAAPPDLSEVVLEATERRPGPRIGLAWVLAAAASVALAIGVGGAVLLEGVSHRPGGPAPVNSAWAALGDPLSVAQALAIRDSTTDDRELVVAGFQSGSATVPCPFEPGNPNPTRIHCPESMEWLMADPEVLWTTSGNVSSGRPPTGPAFHASYATVERGFVGDALKATPVVVVGHFHDRRAARCLAAEAASCGGTFVVDRVSFVNGGPRTITTLRLNDRWDAATQTTETLQPIATETDVDGLVLEFVPEGDVLSRQLRTGDQVADVEPALRDDSHYANARLVWILAVLDLRDDVPVARTFVVVDGTTTVVEMTPAGPVVLVRGIVQPSPDDAQQSPGVSTLRGTLLANPIDVAGAIDRRDRHLGDGEIAVVGWAQGPAGPIACPMIRPGMPAALQCPNTFTWISDALPPTRPNGEMGPPPQPAFNLIVSPEAPEQVDLFAGQPIRVIAVGHFDDPRAASCPAQDIEACRRNFVVDAILDPVNPVLDPNVGASRLGVRVQPVATADQVIAIATLGSDGPAAILSVVAVRSGAAAELAPHVRDAPELVRAPIVWVVRFVDRLGEEAPTLETRLVIDGPPGELPNNVYLPTRTEILHQTTIVN
jgi:hypothetical protein